MKSSARGKHQDHDQEKEDHLAPTKIDQDNNPNKEQDIGANLSHGELQNRLDLYSRIGGHKDQYFKVQAMKERYREQMKEIEANRSKADVHYGQGVRIGLPHTRHKIIQDIRERSDQQFRDEVTKKAKSYYRESNSLSKNFREHKPQKEGLRQSFEKTKNKGIDRER